MSQAICRLCLNSERLISAFDGRLNNSHELLLCVVLCTGVEIKETDLVSKMVCRSCLSVAIKLFQFRTTALANDKTLKEQVGQEYVTPLHNKDDILKLHEDILNSISHVKVYEPQELPPDDDDNNVETESPDPMETDTIPQQFPDPIETSTISQQVPDPIETDTMSQQLPDPIAAATVSQQFPDPISASTISQQLPDPIVAATISQELPDPIAAATISQQPPDPIEETATAPQPDEEVAPDFLTDSEILHPSVKDVLKIYSDLILPEEVLSLDVLPALPLDPSEANKYLGQLQYYQEEEELPETDKEQQETTSSFSDKLSNIEIDINNEILAQRNALEKLKRERERAFLLNKNSGYYADPDYYGGNVFRHRKRRYEDVSDEESCNDWDSESSDSEAEVLRQVELITRAASKQKIPRLNSYIDSDSDSDLLGFPSTDEVRVCEYCDKVCYSRSQLRHHERTHRKCSVCYKIFRTDDALEVHLKNTCYRKIQENQPFLQLIRIDDHPLVVKQYQPAFEYFFSRMNDETYEGYGKREEENDNFPLYHTEDHITTETAFITDVFKKFQGAENVPVKRNKPTQTRRSDISIKYSNQNQIILEDLFSDLFMYKVPIQMVVDQKISADISYTTRPSIGKTSDDWSEETATNVIGKPKLLSLTCTPPVLNNLLSSPRTSVIKTVTVRTKTVPKNKGGNTKTVSSNNSEPRVAKVTNAASLNRQQIYNISRILTAVTTNPQQQIYTVPKTTVTLASNTSQLNAPPPTIKREDSIEAMNETIPPLVQHSNINLPSLPPQNILFKIPPNPARQIINRSSEPPPTPPMIKEEPSQNLSEPQPRPHPILGPRVPLESRANSIFRFNFNQQNHNNPPNNPSVPFLRPPPRNNHQYVPNHGQNGLRNITLNGMLSMKNHQLNRNGFFPSSSSPINSAPSPIPTKMSPPIDYFSSNSPSDSYSSPNSYSSPKPSLQYPPQYPPAQENPGLFETDSFSAMNSGGYPPENSVPYSDPYGSNNPYPPAAASDPYSPNNGFHSNSFPPSDGGYTPNSYPSASYTPPQYIPPYNPLAEFGFGDTNPMHLLPPQHLNTSAVGGKVFLRVKQPWELNQT